MGNNLIEYLNKHIVEDSTEKQQIIKILTEHVNNDIFDIVTKLETNTESAVREYIENSPEKKKIIDILNKYINNDGELAIYDIVYKDDISIGKSLKSFVAHSDKEATDKFYKYFGYDYSIISMAKSKY